jgi:hypothetical protein
VEILKKIGDYLHYHHKNSGIKQSLIGFLNVSSNAPGLIGFQSKDPTYNQAVSSTLSTEPKQI